ncbi:hypothetical protein BDD43_2833 [Mucilaginibacter gracilis]|uniref:Uncharacterized protein n=1 Tax=Mucilaginibacter gracilis TaxID=423350 RepID=A0A495J2P9_9SPHI|nr:hypothetical protein [Mucilaginibacter gracilis]RKR82648.1 hypothetical protein BDD43_2833 [Mucilaginibacter gracilis]
MVSLIKSPQKYSPVNNPLVFQIQSDNVNIQYFAVQLLNGAGAIINNFRLFTSPNYRNGTVADFSDILSNTINSQLLPSVNLIDATPNILTSYQLNITEKLYSGGTIVDGVTLISDRYHTWMGGVDKLSFSSYYYPDYVAIPYNNAKFLTTKPDNLILDYQSSEYLSFINSSGATKVQINTYNKVLLSGYTKSLTGTSKALRIDVSPFALNREFNIDFTLVDYYTVQLLDNSNSARSNLKSYKFKAVKNTDRVEVLFANKLGGFDSCSFFNIRQAINNITPTTINKNPYDFDSSTGTYSEINNGVYNPEVDTINVNYDSTYKAITRPLNDAQGFWLKELMTSPKVYIKVANGAFLPIQIKNTIYTVNRQKFNQNLMRLELEFGTGSYDGLLFNANAVIGSTGTRIFGDEYGDEYN